eukprot:TRINITY_DN2838_c0_g1_i5.p4 TRINITY_DN2838_c0_g1~~TRINITY_DN2838_c0_g1_i5.p4  ORF type:complete len:100 (+),score=2.54 TRINITY_DN2838_c0_g1_i5:43-300(+)
MHSAKNYTSGNTEDTWDPNDRTVNLIMVIFPTLVVLRLNLETGANLRGRVPDLQSRMRNTTTITYQLTRQKQQLQIQIKFRGRLN